MRTPLDGMIFLWHNGTIAEPSPDFRMAEAVAAFGMILNDSPFKGQATLEAVLERVSDPAVSYDLSRKEFVGLVAKAIQMEAVRPADAQAVAP